MRYPRGKPLIFLGNDEMIIKQFLLTKKSWTGLNGQIRLVIGKNIGMRRQQWKREKVHSKSHSPQLIIYLYTI
jgi:hypothetical protein